MFKEMTNVPAEQQGIYRKFEVTRVHPSDKHQNCRYFVLDLDHDPHAPAAMRAYAERCKDTHPLLSQEILAEFGEQVTEAVSQKIQEGDSA